MDGVKVGNVSVSSHQLDPQDPPAAASTALACVVDLYRRGVCEPLPLFRKASAAMHAQPQKLPDWPDAFPDAAEMLAYGHLSAAELCEIPVRADDPPGPQTDRARRYAQCLFGTLDATLVEATE